MFSEGNKYFHCTNKILLLIHAVTMESDHKIWECLITTNTGEGWIAGTAGITGLLLFVVLAIMTVFSLPCVRRQGHFEVCQKTELNYEQCV